MDLGGLCCLWLLFAITMTVPKRLKNIVYQFKHSGDELTLVAEKIQQLAGVEEVMVMAEDGMAYLKVNEQFQREQLDALEG